VTIGKISVQPCPHDFGLAGILLGEGWAVALSGKEKGRTISARPNSFPDK
jgi:hypothetical protein